MPARDRSGPLGMGPMTGGGRGYCAGYDAPGWADPGPGRRFFGRGGGGWAWRHQYYATGLPRWAGPGVAPAFVSGAPYAPPSREQEVEVLRDEAKWLQEQLDSVSKRMDDLSQE